MTTMIITGSVSNADAVEELTDPSKLDAVSMLTVEVATFDQSASYPNYGSITSFFSF